MARESKRKRDEKRFGKPQRLADRLQTIDMGIPVSFTNNVKAPSKELVDSWQYQTERVVDEAIKSKIILANNVRDYFCGSYLAKEFNWLRDLPCVMPPFPSLFVEMSRPVASPPGYPEDFEVPDAWGLLINLTDPDGWTVGGSATDRGYINVCPSTSETKFFLNALLFEENQKNNLLDVGRLGCILEIDNFGRILGEPDFGLIFQECANANYREKEIQRFKSLAAPAFLSLAFLNCKNVTVEPVEPDHQFNRERRKAGLKPFIRYHTINIEPMKKVLRTEGQVETHGLQRALHICRGHFATYSEERPLFGRLTGTYWRPSHVRGSLEQGVVVSDYKINAPAPTEDQPK